MKPRVSRLPAAAAVTAVTVSGCQNVLQAPIPAPPTCPPGRHWVAISASRDGCVTQ